MRKTPQRDKLIAARANPKALEDRDLLDEAIRAYERWIAKLSELTAKGEQRVLDATQLLNEYKDYLEVEILARQGSPFLKRQKGQLKLDNSIMEEFLIHMVQPEVIDGLPDADFEVGPRTAFMTLSFRPESLESLGRKPAIVMKAKDQDFAIGRTIHFKASPDADFRQSTTDNEHLFLAVLSAEIKVNLDKTMFQECCGTASRLKQGCPSARYYVLVEYLDMEPEDSRLTDIDNVFLLRHAKRLPSHKRSIYAEVRDQHREHPIDGGVIYRFVQEIAEFLAAVWHDPDEAIRRGSFA
ncbi:MAG TPA: Bpu10I family restriction endonuclease [Armatimonadota bacterium]|nr:Bpu10I family restriction endonuclease [Armatimonadota bacterium]